MKVKIIELLNSYEALTKIGNNNSLSASILFKFKVSLLIRNINGYIEVYTEQLQDLINEYNIKIQDNQFVSQDNNIENLQQFLKQKSDLEQVVVDLDIGQIPFDTNINNLSANDLLNLSSFFDYSEFMQS